MSQPVTITVILPLKHEAADAFCDAFPGILEETKLRKGFRSLEIHRNEADPSRIIIIENWATREDYLAYTAWRMADGGQEAFEAILASAPVTEFWTTKVA